MHDLSLGIDFGSNSCRACAFNGGRFDQVAQLTSQIALTDCIVIGKDANRELETRHHNLLRHIAAGLHENTPKVLSHPRGGDMEISPTLSAAILLEKLQTRIASRLGRRCNKATFTIPAALTSHELGRLKLAASAVGIEANFVLSPIATALYHANRTRFESTGKFLVLDLGCRFSSCAIVEVNDGEPVQVLELKALRKGGWDIDVSLVKNANIQDDDVHPTRLYVGAESAKKDLTSLRQSQLAIRQVTERVTRDELEEAAKDLLLPLERIIKKFLERHPEVKCGLVVGGTSRLDCLKQILSRNGIVCEVTDPEYSPVMGASLISCSPDPSLFSFPSTTFQWWAQPIPDLNKTTPYRLLQFREDGEYMPMASRWELYQRLVEVPTVEEEKAEEILGCKEQPPIPPSEADLALAQKSIAMGKAVPPNEIGVPDSYAPPKGLSFAGTLDTHGAQQMVALRIENGLPTVDEAHCVLEVCGFDTAELEAVKRGLGEVSRRAQIQRQIAEIRNDLEAVVLRMEDEEIDVAQLTKYYTKTPDILCNAKRILSEHSLKEEELKRVPALVKLLNTLLDSFEAGVQVPPEIQQLAVSASIIPPVSVEASSKPSVPRQSRPSVQQATVRPVEVNQKSGSCWCFGRGRK